MGSVLDLKGIPRPVGGGDLMALNADLPVWSFLALPAGALQISGPCYEEDETR